MTRREKAEVWRNRIEYLREKRRIFFEGNDTWVGADFAIAAYRGETKPDWWSESDPWVSVNKVKSAIRAALPSLLYSNPEFRISPKITDDEAPMGADPGEFTYQRAKAQGLWLNHVWEETSATLHTRIAIQNAFVSYGVLKAGYRAHFQDDKTRGEFAFDDDTGEYILDEFGDPTLARGKFLKEDGDILRDADGIPLLNPGKIQKEEWFVEAIDPKLMLFDIESGPDFFQHRFVIEEWIRPLTDVQNDPRYRRSVRENIVQTETVNGPASQRRSILENSSNPSGSESQAAKTDEARVRGFDIYDFETGEYLVLADSAASDVGGNEEFLLDGPMPAGLEHGPYRFLKFTEDMGTEWYPIPDGIDMALVNREYNITRSQMMIHREHTKTRYLEMPGAYEGHEGVDAEEERAKWAHGPDGASIRVSGPNAILPAPKPQLDGSFMLAIPNIAMDFNEVGGMPGEARGVADAATATQASILATGNEVRNNDRRDNQVHNFLCQVGRMLLMSGQANSQIDSLVVEKVAQSAGGVSPFKARRIYPEELQGEFNVNIAIGSTMPKNDPRTMQQILTYVQALMQNPTMGMIKGLNRRILDGMGLDPLLADEIYDVALQVTQMQTQPTGGGNNGGGDPAGAAGGAGQELQTMLGAIGSAAGGAPTGGSLN